MLLERKSGPRRRVSARHRGHGAGGEHRAATRTGNRFSRKERTAGRERAPTRTRSCSRGGAENAELIHGRYQPQPVRTANAAATRRRVGSSVSAPAAPLRETIPKPAHHPTSLRAAELEPLMHADPLRVRISVHLRRSAVPPSEPHSALRPTACRVGRSLFRGPPSSPPAPRAWPAPFAKKGGPAGPPRERSTMAYAVIRTSDQAPRRSRR